MGNRGARVGMMRGRGHTCQEEELGMDPRTKKKKTQEDLMQEGSFSHLHYYSLF